MTRGRALQRAGCRCSRFQSLPCLLCIVQTLQRPQAGFARGVVSLAALAAGPVVEQHVRRLGYGGDDREVAVLAAREQRIVKFLVEGIETQNTYSAPTMRWTGWRSETPTKIATTKAAIIITR